MNKYDCGQLITTDIPRKLDGSVDMSLVINGPTKYGDTEPYLIYPQGPQAPQPDDIEEFLTSYESVYYKSATSITDATNYYFQG